MQRGQEEAEGAALHRRLDGHGATGALVEAGDLRGEEAQQATHEVQRGAGDLQWEPCVVDRLGTLGDARPDEQHGGDHADHLRRTAL